MTLTTLLIAAGAFVIGIWTAVGIVERRAVLSDRLLVGFVLSVVAGGLWSIGIHIGASYPSKALLWIEPLLGSALVEAAGIALGLRRLARHGVRLSWPPSFA